MEHRDHVALIRGGVTRRGGVWADLGSGRGAFTLALAELLGEGAMIHSVDRDGGALREQEQLMNAYYPHVIMRYHEANFAGALSLPSLDGIVMANSLHFHRDKEAILSRCFGWLKPEAQLILVEYNSDRGNPWVPHPLSYPTWERLAARAGFTATRLLATHPSRFLREIYAAASKRPVPETEVAAPEEV